jgi:hypothetical protein
MVAFASRIFIVWFSGVLFSSGWLNEELQQMLLTDPAIADAVQVALSAVTMGLWGFAWKLAKRWGWAT